MFSLVSCVFDWLVSWSCHSGAEPLIQLTIESRNFQRWRINPTTPYRDSGFYFGVIPIAARIRWVTFCVLQYVVTYVPSAPQYFTSLKARMSSSGKRKRVGSDSIKTVRGQIRTIPYLLSLHITRVVNHLFTILPIGVIACSNLQGDRCVFYLSHQYYYSYRLQVT